MSGDHSANVTVKAGTAVAKLSGGGIRVTVTLPYAWMIRGYILAVRRFHAAAARQQTDARDLCIALFEASTWLDSLSSRGGLTRDADLEALKFVRNRTHHHWAAAIYFDQAQGEWVWYPSSNFPLPPDPHFHQPQLEREYQRLLAGRPVREVLDRLEPRVIALDTTADLLTP